MDSGAEGGIQQCHRPPGQHPTGPSCHTQRTSLSSNLTLPRSRLVLGGRYTLAAREKENGVQLLPVQYCSAKLPDYMSAWYPCELECVGAVLSIEQVAHWINESKYPTTVMPDSMPVVKAANLMKAGKHSKNPRLQSLLSCVNRRNVVFVHSSA